MAKARTVLSRGLIATTVTPSASGSPSTSTRPPMTDCDQSGRASRDSTTAIQRLMALRNRIMGQCYKKNRYRVSRLDSGTMVDPVGFEPTTLCL